MGVSIGRAVQRRDSPVGPLHKDKESENTEGEDAHAKEWNVSKDVLNLGNGGVSGHIKTDSRRILTTLSLLRLVNAAATPAMGVCV